MKYLIIALLISVTAEAARVGESFKLKKEVGSSDSKKRKMKSGESVKIVKIEDENGWPHYYFEAPDGVPFRVGAKDDEAIEQWIKEHTEGR